MKLENTKRAEKLIRDYENVFLAKEAIDNKEGNFVVQYPEQSLRRIIYIDLPLKFTNKVKNLLDELKEDIEKEIREL